MGRTTGLLGYARSFPTQFEEVFPSEAARGFPKTSHSSPFLTLPSESFLQCVFSPIMTGLEAAVFLQDVSVWISFLFYVSCMIVPSELSFQVLSGPMP